MRMNAKQEEEGIENDIQIEKASAVVAKEGRGGGGIPNVQNILGSISISFLVQ